MSIHRRVEALHRAAVWPAVELFTEELNDKGDPDDLAESGAYLAHVLGGWLAARDRARRAEDSDSDFGDEFR